MWNFHELRRSSAGKVSYGETCPPSSSLQLNIDARIFLDFHRASPISYCLFHMLMDRFSPDLISSFTDPIVPSLSVVLLFSPRSSCSPRKTAHAATPCQEQKAATSPLPPQSSPRLRCPSAPGTIPAPHVVGIQLIHRDVQEAGGHLLGFDEPLRMCWVHRPRWILSRRLNHGREGPRRGSWPWFTPTSLPPPISHPGLGHRPLTTASGGSRARGLFLVREREHERVRVWSGRRSTRESVSGLGEGTR